MKLGFFYHDELSMIPFTTTKTDVDKKRSNLPQTQPEVYLYTYILKVHTPLSYGRIINKNVTIKKII